MSRSRPLARFVENSARATVARFVAYTPLGLMLTAGLIQPGVSRGIAAVAAPAAAHVEGGDSLRKTGVYDARIAKSSHTGGPVRSLPAKFQADVKTAARMTNGQSALKAGVKGLKLANDEILASPVSVRSSTGVLAKAAPGSDSGTVVKTFLFGHADAFGLSTDLDKQLTIIAAPKSANDPRVWVKVKQNVGGVPVFRGTMTALVNADGDLASIVSGLAPGLSEETVGKTSSLRIDAESALAAAALATSVKAVRTDLARKSSDDGLGGPVRFADTPTARDLSASLVVFPLAPGKGVYAWQVTIANQETGYIVVVDAENGDILFGKTATQHQTQPAQFSYYEGDSPAPFTPYPNTATRQPTLPPQYVERLEEDGSIISSIQRDLATTTVQTNGFAPAGANRLGWIPDFSNLTIGNNVSAYRDSTPGDGIDTDPSTGRVSTAYGVPGTAVFQRNFTFPFRPAPNGNDSGFGAVNQDRYNAGIVTNLFFWTNWFHDQTYSLGFDEQNGNFQAQNFGRGGSQNDPVNAEALDYSSSNNANFTTFPDGVFAGRMQLFRFPDMQDGATPVDDPATGASREGRDSALDQQIVLHELTHGLSNRLIFDALGLTTVQAGGLGEGWSDYFALSLLSDFSKQPAGATTNNDPDLVYPMGGWITYGLGCLGHDNYFYGVRRYPYSANRVAGPRYNPLNFSAVDPAQYLPLAGGRSYYAGAASLAAGVAPENPLCLALGGSEVHNLGEVWGGALWQARSQVMNSYKSLFAARPAIAASLRDAYSKGNRHALQLVTDAMKLTNPGPTFLSARDALVEAALQGGPTGDFDPANPIQLANPTQAQIDELSVWIGFAIRGMGYFAQGPTASDNATRGIGYPPGNGSFYFAQGPPECSRNGAFPIILDDTDSDVLAPEENGLPDVITLTDDKAVSYYGRSFTKIYVYDNGYITFGDENSDDAAQPDSGDGSLASHAGNVQISGYLSDIVAGTGSVYYAATRGGVATTFENADAVAIVWQDVQTTNAAEGDVNTFSIEVPLTSSGFVRLNYNTLTSPGIIGLSLARKPPDEYTGFRFDTLGPCDIDPANPGTEYFTQVVDSPQLIGAIAGKSFRLAPFFTSGFRRGTVVESFAVPLQAQTARIIDEVSGVELASMAEGGTYRIVMPVTNLFEKANLSNGVGVLSLQGSSAGAAVISQSTVSYVGTPPNATRGEQVASIKPGDTDDGLLGFQVSLVPGATACGSAVNFLFTFSATDQGIDNQRSALSVTVSGAPVILPPTEVNTSWPVPSQSTRFRIANAPGSANAGARSTIVVDLSDPLNAGLLSGVRAKNQRTGEIVETARYVSPNFEVIRALNPEYLGNPAPAMALGDVFVFDSVGVPDGAEYGYTSDLPVTAAQFPVGGDGLPRVVGRVTVRIDELRHDRVGDLTIKLISPDGRTEVTLLDQLRNEAGLADIQDIRNIMFDDNSGTPIQTAGTLVSGNSYRPASKLSGFNSGGAAGVGTWKLKVIDRYANRAGELVKWTLSFGPAPAEISCGTGLTPTAVARYDATTAGWVPLLAGDLDRQSAGVFADNPTMLALTTLPGDSVRVPAWQSPGVALSGDPDLIYRFNTWVSRVGQPDPADQSQIPNLRLRASIRYAQSSFSEYMFDPTQFDPATAATMLSMAPGSDIARPTRYSVDFHPLGVPSLFNQPASEMVRGTVENYSIFPNEQGSLVISESSIERFKRPLEFHGIVLRSYTAADFTSGTTTVGNLFNPVQVGAGGPAAVPTVTVGAAGVTLDSTGVGNEGASFAMFDFMAPDRVEGSIKPGKLYRARFHVTSDTPADNNPQFRLRARAAKFSLTHHLDIGSAHVAGPVNNLIAAESLPGLGSRNPRRRGNETNGGFYDLFFTSPPSIPVPLDQRVIRFGFDLVDGVYPVSTPAQIGVSGRATLDSIELREFDAP